MSKIKWFPEYLEVSYSFSHMLFILAQNKSYNSKCLLFFLRLYGTSEMGLFESIYVNNTVGV